MADPEFYRDKEEVEHWRKLDPITSFTGGPVCASGILTQEEVDAMNERVEGESTSGASSPRRARSPT